MTIGGEKDGGVKLFVFANIKNHPPFCIYLIISEIKSLTVKLFLLYANFIRCNFATQT